MTSYHKPGDVVELEPPVKEGYTFSHWEVTSGNGTVNGSEFTMGNRECVVTAIWISNSYKISYTLNGGTKGTNAPTTANYGSVVTIDNPTRPGYIFVGWTVTSGLNTSTARYGTTSTAVTNTMTSSTKITAKYFTNLTLTNNSTVTLTAN